MTDEKSHIEQGQIQRAQRLRQVIENLKQDNPDEDSSTEGKSLKEQIDQRAREAAQRQGTSDSE